MSHEIGYQAQEVARLLDRNYGQDASDVLRQAIYNWPERATIDLVNQVNTLERNGVGADLIVTPQVRNYYDQSGRQYRDTQYLVSVLTPVNNRQFDPQIPYRGQVDEYGRPMGQIDRFGNPIDPNYDAEGNWVGPVDPWGRPLPMNQPQFDQHGRMTQRPQFDRYGNPIGPGYDPSGRPYWPQQRTYIQEDLGVIRSDGSIVPLRSRPRYVER